jgi:hypothetical protein
MSRTWFRPFGWTYRPTAWKGFGVVGLALLVFLAVDRHSHSVSDTLYAVLPFIVPMLLLLHWIASRKSQAPDQSEASASRQPPPQ